MKMWAHLAKGTLSHGLFTFPLAQEAPFSVPFVGLRIIGDLQVTAELLFGSSFLLSTLQPFPSPCSDCK